MSAVLDPLDRLVASLDYPMAIVTCAADNERAGCLVGFATQCSIDPMRYLVCISRANRTFAVACRTDVLVVHFPGRSQRDLAALFGEETGDEVDKFARCDWRPGPGDAPVLANVPRWLAGRVHGRVDLGDHVGFVVEPVDAACDLDEPPLGFQSVQDLQPGHPA